VELVIGGFPPNFNAKVVVPAAEKSLLGTAADTPELDQLVPSQSSVAPEGAIAIAAVCRSPLPPSPLLVKLLRVVHEVPLYPSVAVVIPKASPAVCVPAPVLILLPVFKFPLVVQDEPLYS
jgi:hypothetical protein